MEIPVLIQDGILMLEKGLAPVAVVSLVVETWRLWCLLFRINECGFLWLLKVQRRLLFCIGEWISMTIRRFKDVEWFSLSLSIYPQTSNISYTLVGNKIVDHSDVVGAASVGVAPTTSSFLTQHLASMDWAKTTARRDEKHLSLGIWCVLD